VPKQGPYNNQGAKHQNGFVQIHNISATGCSVAVRGVQPTSNISEALLKAIEEVPASANPCDYQNYGQEFVQRRQVYIADGRKERAQKNNPRSCNRPLLLFIEPHFFMECRAVYFILII
jgi:hypothetical protein